MKHDDERCTLSDIGMEVTGEDAPALNSYLAVFAKPDEKGRCLKCGTVQSGLGGFRWGLVHGEGECGTCGWPGRAAHYPKDSDADDMFDSPLRVVLQYHPDNVKERSSDD